MQKYLIVIEKAKSNYSAYSPDVDGCIATGDTVERTLQNIKDALEFHIEGTVDAGEGIPHPKGIEYHLQRGDFLLEEDTLVTQIEVHVPDAAVA